MTPSKQNIAIVGGGISGLTLAIAMRKLGFQPIIFESAPEVRALGAGLALAANAIMALKRLGIADKIIPAGRQLDTFSVLDQHGKPITVADTRVLSARYGIDNFTIHRTDLHRILLQELDDVQIVTGKKVIQATQNKAGVTLTFEDETQHHAAYVLAADGIHSAIRRQLMPESTPRYAGYTCWRAVIQDPGLALSASTETWGSAGRVGLVPLRNNQVYWFLCINARQNDPAMRRLTSADLAHRFRAYHEPIPTILRATPDESLIYGDIIDLQPIQRYAHERILLLGDAAHATTPNMGQGACQAIEDSAVLLHLWEKMPNHPPEDVFRAFEQQRLSRTHLIVNQSWRIGKVSQWTNPLAIALRNGLFRMIPASVKARQMATLYQVDFECV